MNLPITTSLNYDHRLDTVDVYNNIAIAYVKRTLDADMAFFYEKIQKKVKANGKLLDIGAGSGRDAVALTGLGFNVDVLEPSNGLLDLFTERNPHFPGKVYPKTIQNATLPPVHYDCIYASASLLHIIPEDWAGVLQKLHASSKENGLLYISVKKCPSGFDSEGRWFTGFTSIANLQEVVELSSPWKMTQGDMTSDSLGRGTTWLEAWFIS